MPRPSKSGQMTINLPSVIKTLGESLYSDPSVSVRELIQNAHDSCVVRQADDLKPPPSEIHLRFDSWKRTLIIEDNGAGMTEDEVKEFLTVIGNSKTDQVRERLELLGQANLAERLIGRFGLGLLSAFIIGDRIEFTTLSFKNGAKPIWWECDGGQTYRMGPAEGKTLPGTIVTVYVNPKHIGLLKDDKLAELIHLYADLLEVPIYLDPIRRPVNAMDAPWNRKATEAEYRQFVTERFPNDTILDVIPLRISEDGGKFKVGGMLFVPKQPLFLIKEHGDLLVYVRRMFVCKNERTLLPEWAKFVKGIVESPNLRETTSREAILRDENFLRIRQALGQAILDYLTQVSRENPHLLREIVSNHNLVIKAWAIESDELFDCVKDLVLFETDAGMINLPRYFETSRIYKGVENQESDKRYLFYFTTPGGAGQNAVLFAAKGLHVIDAQHFPDESFLKKYAKRQRDVLLRRLGVGGDFIFEQIGEDEHQWVELERAYSYLSIEAKVVRFLPEDIPAVLLFPQEEPLKDQVETLLADPNLSPSLKNLVRHAWQDRDKHQQRSTSAGSILYLNANNSVMQKLVDLDLSDYEIQDLMTMIYNNTLIFSTQGSGVALTIDSVKRVFESNNRTIATLLTKVHEVRDHKLQRQADFHAMPPQSLSAAAQTPSDFPDQQNQHIICLAALPPGSTSSFLLEGLRDVLEMPPYFWQVVCDERLSLDRNGPENLGSWISRSHCFMVDLSKKSNSSLMELGHMYWGYPGRTLIILKREGANARLPDLGSLIHISYPWSDEPNRTLIAAAIREQLKMFDELKSLRGAHYLSTRLMQVEGIPARLTEVLAERYRTVEEFLGVNAELVSQELGTHLAPVGVVYSLHKHLRELCGLA